MQSHYALHNLYLYIFIANRDADLHNSQRFNSTARLAFSLTNFDFLIQKNTMITLVLLQLTFSSVIREIFAGGGL